MSTKQQRGIALLSFPNKSVEMPSLGIAILKEAIQQAGHTCIQYDFNILLKDAFIEPENLHRVAGEVLPYLWECNLDNMAISDSVAELAAMINQLDRKYSAEALCEVKRQLQRRAYAEVFCDSIKSNLATLLIRIILRTNHFFNLVVSNPHIEQDFPDLFVFSLIQQMFEEITTNEPYLIGISVTAMQRRFSLWSITKLRHEFGYTGPFVVGGPDATYFRTLYLKHYPFIDYLVYQEGEESVVKLVEYLKAGTPLLSDIPNLIYRVENTIVTNPPADVQIYPNYIPDFRDLPLDKYITDALPVQASRGCSWARCTFCKHFRTYGRDYYERPPREIVDHITTLKARHGTWLFHFVDDDFPLHLKNAVADEIIHGGLDIRCLVYSRFDRHITKEMLQKWYDAGMVVIEWGLESTSQNILNRIKKGTSLPEIKRLLFEANDVGILNKLFLFHNLPGESYEHLWSSILFVKAFVSRGIVRPFWEIRTPLELLTGTPLYEETFADEETWGGNFKKAFHPRGELIAQAGYIHHHNYAIKKTILSESISVLNEMAKSYGVLEANDEDVMLDVILEELRRKGSPLKLHARIIAPTSHTKG